MALEEVLVKKEDGMKYMPELYAVPADKVKHFAYSYWCYGCDDYWSPGFLIWEVFILMFVCLCIYDQGYELL